MYQPSIITEYIDSLTHELRFDRALAQRVRREVEDHLWESADDASLEAQRRAIAMFGSPREIAGQYAALSLWRQARRTITLVIVAMALIFVSMKLRMSWYQFLHWGLSADMQEVGIAGMFVARCGFMLAFAVATIGWAYIASRRVPVRLHATYQAQLKRGLLLCVLSVGPLMVSVFAGSVLTALRLFEASSIAVAALPLLTVTAELTLIAILVLIVRGTVQRITLAAQLS